MAGTRRLSMVPSDVRLSNALRIIEILRRTDGISRSEVARELGLSVPAVHRLMSELLDAELVEEEAPPSDATSIGRPASIYRFRQQVGLLVGVDVGNETTRLMLCELNLSERARMSMPTSEFQSDVARLLGIAISDMVKVHGTGAGPLVGVGVGVAATVNPETGAIDCAPVLSEFEGIRLAHALEDALGCSVAVQQDDHYSGLAESSPLGTVPGSTSLLVLEIGFGIGVGMCIGGVPLSGYHGRFGRIASWPVSNAHNCTTVGSTLGEALTARGLVRQYHDRGGGDSVANGLDLIRASRAGDPKALAVVEWAAQEIADVIQRLVTIVDPEAVVLGGGLGRAYEEFAPKITDRLPKEVNLYASVLQDRAVVTGAVLEASRFVDGWLRDQLLRT